MNFEAIEIRTLTFKKNVLGGFRKMDVNDFLRNVADDYETYDERIRRLVEDISHAEAKLSTYESSQDRKATQLENEKGELQRKIQQLEEEKRQLELQKEPLEHFREMQIDYHDLEKMKRIAQRTLAAAEKAANQLLEEAEKRRDQMITEGEQEKATLIMDGQQQKKTLLDQAEDERLQYMFEAKLEISTIQKEQDQEAAALLAEKEALEQKRQELQQLKIQMKDEVQTFAAMMAATRQEISQEYLNSIEALTKKNEAERKKVQLKAAPEPPTLLVNQEKEVM